MLTNAPVRLTISEPWEYGEKLPSRHVTARVVRVLPDRLRIGEGPVVLLRLDEPLPAGERTVRFLLAQSRSTAAAGADVRAYREANLYSVPEDALASPGAPGWDRRLALIATMEIEPPSGNG